MRQRLIIPIISFFVVWTLFSTSIFASNQNPQYIFVRKDNTCSNCSLWNGAYPDNYNATAVQEIINGIGSRGTDNRRLGIGALFHYFSGPSQEAITSSLQNLLKVSQDQDIPILLAFDGFQWWSARPDLWNWWDPSKPGYNPDNKKNVEWTCWDASCATNKAWRNWGSEFQMGQPHPNIASSAFLNANTEALNHYLPLVRDWYNTLPPDKKYLLGGVVIGTEDDIGANYYYYPNGVSTGGGIKSSVQLGYAAVRTAGIKTSGSIVQSDLTTVLNNYLTSLTRTAYQIGIPRNKIFTHSGGGDLEPSSFSSNLVYPSSSAALTAYGQPGWSFYGLAANPGSSGVLSANLNNLSASPWASPEWLYMGDDYNGWVNSLKNSLSYRNNAFINVANWEGVRSKPDALRALRDVLNENPSCWNSAPHITNFSLTGNTLNLSWMPGSNNAETYLNISNQPDTNSKGLFLSINVANERVTGLTSYVKQIGDPNAKYYALLAADGCNQRKIAYASTAVIPTATPIPPTSTRVPPTNTPIISATSVPKVTGDANNDNRVTIDDFVIWKKEFSGALTTKNADFNNDGKVNMDDFVVWKKKFAGL